ncbi:hypothetical protein BHM03_00002543 [Ensete ventricosum]|nr:hypothetical protein BHM03_00002543 [Ensete ventricosum]
MPHGQTPIGATPIREDGRPWAEVDGDDVQHYRMRRGGDDGQMEREAEIIGITMSLIGKSCLSFGLSVIGRVTRGCTKMPIESRSPLKVY